MKEEVEYICNAFYLQFKDILHLNKDNWTLFLDNFANFLLIQYNE